MDKVVGASAEISGLAYNNIIQCMLQHVSISTKRIKAEQLKMDP